MMKIEIVGGILEHIRDALDDIVEGKAPALAGIDWRGGDLIMTSDHVAYFLRLIPRRQPDIVMRDRDGMNVARYRDGAWKIAVFCDDCCEEGWSADGKPLCSCKNSRPCGG